MPETEFPGNEVTLTKQRRFIVHLKQVSCLSMLISTLHEPTLSVTSGCLKREKREWHTLEYEV